MLISFKPSWIAPKADEELGKLRDDSPNSDSKTDAEGSSLNELLVAVVVSITAAGIVVVLCLFHVVFTLVRKKIDHSKTIGMFKGLAEN